MDINISLILFHLHFDIKLIYKKSMIHINIFQSLSTIFLKLSCPVKIGPELVDGESICTRTINSTNIVIYQS